MVAVDGMLPLPARAAEIFEALEVSAEVRSYHSVAHGAQGVLQIGVNLDLYEEGGWDKEVWTTKEVQWGNGEDTRE